MTLAEKSKDRKDLIVLAWKADRAIAQRCLVLSFLALVAGIVQLLRGVLNTLSSSGPDWLAIGLTLFVAVSFKVLGQVLSVKALYLTRGGIRFSPGFLFDLYFRLERKWNDIGAIALLDENEEDYSGLEEERRRLVIHFASGGAVSIPLKELTVADLDNLFRGSKRWGSTAVMAPDLIELRRKLVAGPSPSMNLSLTTLWEKELQSHFTTSTFVPLATGVKLHHPQIARVYDHFVENGRDYLVLDYIPGQSLRQLVEAEGPRLEDKVLEWAQAIAGILLYLHGQNPPIIHRDLTPENLVLGEDNLIHLIDFGAANEFAATATGTLIGKQAYIPPEQFRGKPQPASDICALGATMYYLLTGQDPEALSSSNPALVNSSVSVQTGEFVAMLTAVAVADRPADCLEVIQKIADLRATERGAVILLGDKK